MSWSQKGSQRGLRLAIVALRRAAAAYTLSMRATPSGSRLAAPLLAWLAGVALQLQEQALQAVSVYAAALLLPLAGAAVAIVWRRRHRRSALRSWLPLAMCGAALGGFGAAGLQAAGRLAHTLAPELEGRDLVITGTIASLPQRMPNGLRFRFDVDADPQSAEAPLPPKLTLGWYAGFNDDATPSQPQRELRAGQRWRFTVRLRQPHGNLNPNGFDYELRLFEQGVRATGYIRDAPMPQRLGDDSGFRIDAWRQRIRDAIDGTVGDRRAAGVLTALAVGDQGAIDRADWDIFRNTGVAHLVAISGLHIAMFAWIAGLTVAAVWRRSSCAMLFLPVPTAARWGGLALAIAYALLAGWGVPAQRTVLMLATVTIVQGAGARWPWPLVLLSAGVVVTAIDPWALLQAGFWLSFAAVGLLMLSAPSTRDADLDATVPDASVPRAAAAPEPIRPHWSARLRSHLSTGMRTQIVATLGLTPLTLVFFQQVSLVSFLANLIAIPVVTLLVTPLALLGVLAPPLWWIAAAAVQALVTLLGWLGAIPGAVWFVPAAPLWARLAGIAAAVLIVMPIPWRARLLALPLALALLVPPRTLPADGSFDLVAADVGQGMAVIVRTRRHVMLFDAGPQYSRDNDAGQRVLVPLLRARGDAHLDLLVLSHRDLDHVGGAEALISTLDVDAMLSSLEAGHPMHAAARHSNRCEAGQRWTWDGVEFSVLRPAAGDYVRRLKSNGMSCVIRVAGSGRSALLTGDIEREQEALLVAEHGEGLRSDMLLAPHHGSRTSSSAPFLDAVQPSVAVFQAGYRNRFGHPAADVVERYRQRGIAVVVSPSCGAWQWSASDPSAGRCLRQTERRYWRHPASADAVH